MKVSENEVFSSDVHRTKKNVDEFKYNCLTKRKKTLSIVSKFENSFLFLKDLPTKNPGEILLLSVKSVLSDNEDRFSTVPERIEVD